MLREIVNLGLSGCLLISKKQLSWFITIFYELK